MIPSLNNLLWEKMVQGREHYFKTADVHVINGMNGVKNYLCFPAHSFLICQNVESREDDIMLYNLRLYIILIL